MDDVGYEVTTPWGTAHVTFAGTWLAVSADGDLLERDRWRVRLRADDLRVDVEVRTFPEPTDPVLTQAVLREVGVVVTGR